MFTTRHLTAFALSAALCSQAHALLSINVLQDNTTVPGWVINTFTVDSVEQDITAVVAFSDLLSGSMLQVPGFYTFKQSNGPGDSYININDDPNTNGWLGYGDLVGGAPEAFFDETGIGMSWFNIRTSDIGIDMHLATLTFSDDSIGDFDLLVFNGQGRRQSTYSIIDGFVEFTSTIDPRPIPDPPVDPNPLPDPGEDPGGNPGGNPGSGGNPPNPGSGGNSGGNTIPEPAGLGLIALAAATFGGLHRRRLVRRGA